MTNTSYVQPIAAYVRVSTQEQKLHGLSLDAQKEKLKEYAEKNNLRIVDWYLDEGISARKLIKKRPELQRMIKDAQAGKFERIIFIKLDRFFRSVAEYHECMKLIDPVVWTATEEKYDLSTANGRAFVNMKLTIAELEADQTGERIRLVNDYKIKAGLPLFGTQCLPFCYKVEPPANGEQRKRIVKCNAEAMEYVIDAILAKQSIRSALFQVNKKYNLRLRYNGLNLTLKNEMLYGSYKGNPNYCEPYIDKETFDKIQQIIQRNPRTGTDEHTYIFTGLIKCPECHTRLVGWLHSSTKPGRTRQYRYYGYRCGNNRAHKLCSYSRAVFENTLERTLLAELENIIAAKKAALAELKDTHDRFAKHDIEELQKELERLNYAWQKGRIKSAEEYDQQYDSLIQKIEEAHQENAEITGAPDFARIDGIISDGWKEFYMDLDLEHKRAFWRNLISEIKLEWTETTKRIVDIDFL